MDMNDVDNRRNHDCDVVPQVIRVDVTRVSGPPDIAPSMTAAMNVDRRPRGNDGFDLVVHRWTRAHI
jgi:hypothetical protein